MGNAFDGIVDRFLLSSSEFERRLRAVRAEQWCWPTPCTEWNVRQLVNHVTRGNLNYVALVHGGSAADFLRLRDADALGSDPVAAYADSVRQCAEAFSRPGALLELLDYPLGRVTGEQALAVRTTDNTVHAWDLARAVDGDETLDSDLVTWVNASLTDIYADLSETPTAPDTTHRFFAAPDTSALARAASAQTQLLHRMGRSPAAAT
ncbi:TIGR03086 family metal-binding protein [Streptomyces spirodelae]|uniref:TIGR03086 family protein n=1 Tax=Streptomyces spirodelae TaxID=2812904 RepID=A0ABS3WNQ7_9ACTN|nr:TIGR03086 family metal-binding protein [Streptomyces spirodelae]MBO8184759.1 TIGR03086 family protein [Streptomyces spirodelae]